MSFFCNIPTHLPEEPKIVHSHINEHRYRLIYAIAINIPPLHRPAAVIFGYQICAGVTIPCLHVRTAIDCLAHSPVVIIILIRSYHAAVYLSVVCRVDFSPRCNYFFPPTKNSLYLCLMLLCTFASPCLTPYVLCLSAFSPLSAVKIFSSCLGGLVVKNLFLN